MAPNPLRLTAALCALHAATVCAYPSRLSCDKALSTETTMMGQKAALSDSRTVSWYRDGAKLGGSDMYTLGETLTLKISDTSGQYIMEVRMNITTVFHTTC